METPSKPQDETSSPKPVYRVESTGSTWGDIREAVKRLSVRDDIQKIGDIPCARNSLLSGIASGLGIGVIRGMSTSVIVASNWAVGAFMIISIGTWSICQANLENEKRRVQQVVERMPKRFVKAEGGDPKADSQKAK